MGRLLVVCALLGALAGCDVLFPSGGGKAGRLTGLDADGGVCEKDEQTIKNVMLAPPTCNATNPCPCGTFCSSQTGGNCVADCVDDSWCAPGHFCSGYGQCLAGSADGGVGDGGIGPNTDPSCPRSEALLDSLEVMNRSCQFDDQCPMGSHCDHVKERCYAACRSDAYCAAMYNSPGHTFVCGCLGKCAEVAVPRVPPTKVLPTLEVTPRQFIFPRPETITAPAWGTENLRSVSLVVVSPFITTSGSMNTGPVVKIQANPGQGLMVKCPGASGDPAAMPCSFMVDPSTFHSVNGEYRSDPVHLTLKPSTGAPTAETWDLLLSSTDVSTTPVVVSLRYTEQLGGATFPNLTTITAPPPGFLATGIVTLATPTGATLPIAVKAREKSGELVLFDETRQLSPSGKLVLRRLSGDVAQLQTFVNPDLGNDVVLQDSLAGVSFQSIDYSLKYDPASGAISGTLERAIYSAYEYSGEPPTSLFNQPTTGSLRLVPDTSSAVGACGGAGECPVGTTCDLGFCSALPAHRFNPFGISPPPDDFLMHHKRMQRWGGHHPKLDMTGDSLLKNGYWGFYLPNSSYQALASAGRAGYQLHGPLPVVSGEPLADLLTSPGVVIVTNAAPRAVPLLTQQDGAVQQPAAALLRSCIADLSRDRKDALPGALLADPETFDVEVSCINLGRVVWALRDQTTMNRALQGWLDVHSFVLGEGLEEMLLSEATAGIPGTGDPNNPPPTLEQLLGIGESGLGFLLDLSVGSRGPFKTLTAEQLATVDYRPGKLVQSCTVDADCNIGEGPPALTCDPSGACRLLPYPAFPQHEQPIGVPTKVLETATAYLKTLEAYLARMARQTYGQPANGSPSNSRQAALARFGAGMRLVLFAEQLAVAIDRKAPCSTNPANSSDTCNAIAGRFASIRDEMNTVRVRVVAQSEALRTGRNPFNIPEDDVPLFFGDPAGDNSRYFAASDYLLSGWAVPAVEQAQGYLDAARSSWLAQLQSKVQDELNAHNREQEINQLMAKYGAPILDACGGIQVPGPSGARQLESTEVIPYYASATTPLDSTSCFIEPSCVGEEGVDGKRALQLVINDAFKNPDNAGLIQTIDDPGLGPEAKATLFVRSEICKLSNAARGNPYVDFLLSICPADNRTQWETIEPGSPHCLAVRGADDNLYFYADTQAGGGPYYPLAALFGPIWRSDVGFGKFYAQAELGPGPLLYSYPWYDIRLDPKLISWGHSPTRTGPIGEFFATLSADYCGSGNYTSPTDPNYIVHHLHADYARPDPKELPSRCYKGSLGVGVSEMHTDVLRMQQARNVLLGGQANLNDQFNLCKLKDQHFAAINDATKAYEKMLWIYHWQASSAAFGRLDMSTAGYETGSFIGGEGSPFPWSGWHPNREDEAERMRFMESAFGHEEDVMACWNNFRAQRRALVTAADEIGIAASNIRTQQIKFRTTQLQNRLNLEEGIAVYKREKASPLSSLAHVFWVDEKIEQFRKEFEWARRLVFIAMRAVEFEFQQTLPFRSQIVAATTPAQLQETLLGLKMQQAARTVNRRRPEEASVVLSLRDDVLAIADRSDDPVGERNWTPAARFASRLWDDRYAIRNSDGEYLGQGIPFTLGPTGVLETRCGERMWRATATLQGDGIEASAPGASVLLLKRNTFSSQYCNGKSPPVTTSTGATVPGPKMQVGAVHTAAQLFRPGANVDLSDANEFTAALLYPWFNVRRTDFYKATYQDGASEELAGRGLYGDYVLLFPKQVLEGGFSLERVEDVLLRLDYLSVDNLSQ